MSKSRLKLRYAAPAMLISALALAMAGCASETDSTPSSSQRGEPSANSMLDQNGNTPDGTRVTSGTLTGIVGTADAREQIVQPDGKEQLVDPGPKPDGKEQLVDPGPKPDGRDQ